MILLVKISSFWGSVLQRCFTVPSKGISNDRDRGNSPVVVIWFSIVIFSRFSDSLNCDWKKLSSAGLLNVWGYFFDQRRMGSISGIHRSKRWTRAYFKRRCGQSCWYINKQEKIRNSVPGSYCLRNTKSSGKGFNVSTYPYQGKTARIGHGIWNPNINTLILKEAWVV